MVKRGTLKELVEVAESPFKFTPAEAQSIQGAIRGLLEPGKEERLKELLGEALKRSLTNEERTELIVLERRLKRLI
jgi:hypothetical protein